jgi:hypothetical protein
LPSGSILNEAELFKEIDDCAAEIIDMAGSAAKLSHRIDKEV